MKKNIRRLSRLNITHRHIGVLCIIAFLGINQALASTTGQPLPWEGPLKMIMDSISGPVAKMLGVIVIVIAGLGIAFGEAGSGVRRIFQVVLGLAIAFSAASIIATLYNTSSGVVF